MTLNDSEVMTALARQEEQIKGLCRRMDNLERLTESVQKLALSVERLTQQQQATDTQVTTLATEVEEIREKPAKRWDTVIAAIISALVGAGIALLIK